MPAIIERGLFNEPILFIKEQEETNVYMRNYNQNGIPFYSAPEKKNEKKLANMVEMVFLPIKKEEFNINTKKYFFGFRFLFSISDQFQYTLEELEGDMVVSLQVRYEIHRIRYYPLGNNIIKINKSYDSLLPIQIIQIQHIASEIPEILNNVIGNILNLYTEYYVDKKI